MTDFTAAVKKKLKEHAAALIAKGKAIMKSGTALITQTKFPVDGSIRSWHAASEIIKQAGIFYHF
ncbi:hypothetical protein [Chromobacterium phragmitis]|uniref:hypothetical protein n=1 Tax=Chromobacterium phragmitis TaxID=2202141 RepID=UPI0019164BB5|nr:hypothetical protein [Chromobacterium phragmitis]